MYYTTHIYIKILISILNKEMTKMPKPVINIIVSHGVKRAIENASQRLGCSQAEVVRTALYNYLTQLSLITEQVHRSDNQ